MRNEDENAEMFLKNSYIKLLLKEGGLPENLQLL